MKTKIININEKDKNLRIGDVLKMNKLPEYLPSDVIIDKVRPNFGATQLELDCERKSIIIIPFIEVMNVKTANSKRPVCSVDGDKKIHEIENYLLDTNVEHKKFMVTPDSFIKLITVILKHEDVYKNYYLLYDECDQLVTNCRFRENILKPMDYFFKFESKALISATPIIPDDTRFKDNKFSILRFEPLFDYSQDLTLITTNNLRTSIRNILSLHNNDDRPVLIFSNCVQTILYINNLDFVSNKHKIFCADRIKEDFFVKQGATNIENSVASQEYEKFNSFTSRFFAGLDIYLNLKPHIIFLTNIPKSKHSIIDPFTDAIQITGRSRSGVSSITHITKLYYEIPYKDSEELQEEFDFSHKVISRLKQVGIDFNNDSVKQVVNAVADHNLYKLMDVNSEDSRYSYFKQSMLYKLKVENYYTNPTALRQAYLDTNHFKVSYRNVRHAISDQDQLKLQRTSGKDRRKQISNTLNGILNLYIEENTPLDDEFFDALSMLESEDSLIYELFMLGLYMDMEEVEYRLSDLKTLYFNRIVNKRKYNNSDMIDRILISFPLHQRIYASDLKASLQKIYNEFNHVGGYNIVTKAKACHILNYYEGILREPKKPDKHRGYETYYVLGKPKYSLSGDLRRLEGR
ncbi:hypothetical protein J7E50_09825 [Pedobacter sp. ISL-68]|uniref:hypothetical protein n=1 Tax=unclassified Pedobacter TaxID=2628915 RepID=UPI001BE749E1|nr:MULTISPECIES: hypothetical protein [unclassified Pedobacter]MBT2561128.1 hypothetical protein [Pedobacter sp. ISL-64]MBT2590517.1 hypothetical protein [Pedobacter sp. ISL-68]